MSIFQMVIASLLGLSIGLYFATKKNRVMKNIVFVFGAIYIAIVAQSFLELIFSPMLNMFK